MDVIGSSYDNGIEYFNRTSPIFKIDPDFLTQWKLKKKQAEVCKALLKGLKYHPLCQRILDMPSYHPFRDATSSDNTDLLDLNNLDILNSFNISRFNFGNETDTNGTSLATDSTENGPMKVLPPFELWQTIAIAICLALCIILTVGGNILVLLAFIVDRSIRQPSNYFIASLACTDMLIGTVSMPFYTVYVLMGYWDLGPLLCDLWLSVDYTVCLVSQYTVLLITIDRFCSVKIAAKYRSWRTKNKVLWMVSVTWVIPALLFFISIFGWEHFVGYRDLLPGQCAVQFLKDPVFNTALIIGYYWTTLVVLFILYGGIYKTAYEMQKKSEAKQRKMQSMVALSSAMTGMAGRTAGINIEKNELSSHSNLTIALPSIAPLMPGNVTKSNQLGSNEAEVRKLSVGKAQEDQEKTTEEKKAEGEKSERSSSPAFDSDEDSSAPPNPNNTAKSSNVTASIVSAMMKKRSSIAGLLVGPSFGNRANGNVKSPMRETAPNTKRFSTPITPVAEPMPNIQELSCILDTDPSSHESQIQKSPLKPTPVQSPISPQDIEPVVVPRSERQPQLASTVLPPPAGYSPMLSERSETPSLTNRTSSRPSSVISQGDSCLTNDVLYRMDGADLRFMDESSIAVSSPTFESPPGVLPEHKRIASPASQSAQGIANPSLLQKALIQATKTQQPKVLLKSLDLLPNSPPRELLIAGSYNEDTDDENMPTKYDMTVSVSEKPDRPVTTIVDVNKPQTSNLDEALDKMPGNNNNNNSINPNGATQFTPISQTSTSGNTATTVSTSIELNKKPTTVTISTTTVHDNQITKDIPPGTVVLTNASASTTTEGKRKRDFIRSIGKRLKAKKKAVPLLGIGRQKSKSENRARKAFRTISFILGAFVACWTPYHILALVEGFCSNPPCTNEHLYMFSYFLCYANSPMNPFCYAMANQQFKKTFTRILKGDFHMT
ncbi:muscarinic acetylcholine receptor gar-2 [Culicoides brevitarsis]|uniref:muscarinic acetylcholine receptor gar-2 n=1 Tax=Culicoides brevitarsis TaxID=469753 RepID=UPI00307B11E0